MQCKYCQRELPASKHGKREYCNNAHKQAHYRQGQQEEIERLKVQVAAQDEQIKNQAQQIEQLKAHVKEQQLEIGQHFTVIEHLKEQINLEYRYLKDDRERGLISFLKRQPRTPLSERILSDTRLFTRGTHWEYETYFRIHGIAVTEAELTQFKDLWKLMLLETSRDDF
jgi:predicted nuclease with TOPRIM domain